MNAKLNFLRNKELCKYWVSIARDQRFADLITHCRAAMIESRPTQEMIEGAESFIDILETICDNEGSDMPFPSPGLHHDVDLPLKKEKAKK
jgi:hypothetical protein